MVPHRVPVQHFPFPVVQQMPDEIKPHANYIKEEKQTVSDTG